VGYGKVMLDAWAMMRRTGALWRLAAISAAQVVLYSVIVGGLIAPMGVLTQMLVQAQQYDAAMTGLPEPAAVSASREFLAAAVQWLSGHWTPIFVSMAVITTVWAVFGIYDVAATAGMITQAEAVSMRRKASAAAGLRDGFRIWWRTVGLLAIAALPSLIYMLVLALFMFFTVSLPLYRGQVPNAAAMSASNVVTGPLSMIVSIFGIPLSILVALGLRYAVLENREWRDAFGCAWRLAKTRLVEVTLMYFVVFMVLTLVSIVLTVFVAVVAIVGVAVVAWSVSASGGTLTGTAVFVIAMGSLLLIAVSIATMALMLLWQSVAWTVFWRRLTGREPEIYAAQSAAVPSASSQGATQ
jgi:hypothetical protein